MYPCFSCRYRGSGVLTGSATTAMVYGEYQDLNLHVENTLVILLVSSPRKINFQMCGVRHAWSQYRILHSHRYTVFPTPRDDPNNPSKLQRLPAPQWSCFLHIPNFRSCTIMMEWRFNRNFFRLAETWNTLHKGCICLSTRFLTDYLSAVPSVRYQEEEVSGWGTQDRYQIRGRFNADIRVAGCGIIIRPRYMGHIGLIYWW